MQPAARVQAALELLTILGQDLRPVERQLADYFRDRRYVGSGDRRAISDMIFGVLRNRGQLVWRLGENASERVELATYLHALSDLSLDDVSAQFDGQRTRSGGFVGRRTGRHQ